MGTSNSVVRAPRNPVPEGKTRICVAGYKISPYTGNARAIAAQIAADLPENYETWYYFDTSANYYAFLKETFDSVPFPEHLKGHASSPFVWLERGATNEITPIGGNSHLSEWVLAQPDLAAIESIKKLAAGSGLWGPTFHNGASAPQPTADITPVEGDVAPAATEAATTAEPKKADEKEAAKAEEEAAAKKAEEEAAAAKAEEEAAAKKAEEEAAAAKAEEEAAAAKKAEEEAAAAKAEEEAAAAKKAEEEAAAAKAEEEAAAAKKAEEEAAAKKAEEAAAAKKAEEEAAAAKAEEEAAAAKKAEEEAAAAKKAEEEAAATEDAAVEEETAAEEVTPAATEEEATA